MTNYLETMPRDVADELHALDRCMESQRQLARRIDDANPGDPYASMMVAEDAELLERLKARVMQNEATPNNQVERPGNPVRSDAELGVTTNHEGDDHD